MAARWGAGEETTTACNVEFFPMDTLNETPGLNSGETLEVLQSCLDSSILSFFEDTPTIETKGLDDESEANLLTALTEILDNVDDENLSPFDTLPDSDLLSGQKGREHSPLRRLLCLSRSPPEKDSLHRPMSIGKSLPRIQSNALQRSDGEEEDDGSLTLSPTAYDSSCDNDLLDWNNASLPLPVTFEQEGGDGVSISLGDLVRQMHPYCMTICLDNNEEQMLPEGGILLEVVDQGENGEPILAIPHMDLPVSLPCEDQSPQVKGEVAAEAEETSDKLEQIIVVDEDVKDVGPSNSSSDVNDKQLMESPKENDKEKCSLRKKSKNSKNQCQSGPIEGRVLRSGTITKTETQVPRKPEKRSLRREKLKVPTSSLTCPSSTSTKPEKVEPCMIDASAEKNVQIAPSVSKQQQDVAPIQTSSQISQTSCPATAESSKQGSETVKEPVLAAEKLIESSAAPPAVQATPSPETLEADLSPATSPCTPPLCEVFPPTATTVQEPKPKSLSLAEYRQLRQQKKPQPVATKQTNSTKWPSLPELPKELPPIPCLPDPSSKDPRRPNNQAAKKVLEEEVRPAWHPRGPAAPPTPEALLVPPAYMTASSSKASAATAVVKPQNTPQPSRPCPPKQIPDSAEDESAHRAVEVETAHVTERSRSSDPNRYSTSANSESCQALSGENDEKSQPVSQALPNASPQTTTQSLKPVAATPATLTIPQEPTKGHHVAAAASVATLKQPVTADVSSKHMDNDGQRSSSSTAQHSDSVNSAVESGLLESKVEPSPKVTLQKAKDSTRQLIESFTSEIGIEAADLTSLLEQFEETQAKEVKCVPEVSGRAAAVGNSSLDLVPENSVVERVRASDLSSTAALTPPATPPHQMWKPLAPVALLGKSKAADASKLSPSKVIQIEARPLPSFKCRSKPTPVSITVDPSLACKDHDYCLPIKGTSAEEPGEPGKRWNVKQQTFITIKPIKQPTTSPVQTNPPPPESSASSPTEVAVKTKTQHFPVSDNLDHSSVLETPDASPARQDTSKEESSKRESFKRVYRRQADSRTPSPEINPKRRPTGRSRKRSCRRSRSPGSSSSDSDSHSSRSRSRSCAPSKKRYRRRHSQSSSSSSSRSSSRSSSPVSRSPTRRRRYSYSSSRSGSWSRSRSRSQSPQRHRTQWRTSRVWNSPPQRSGYGYDAKTTLDQVKRRKEKAIEERRVVYVGRIRGTMTQKELRERFSLYGEIEECTLHFREQGDNYGFVTYYDTKDAFTAIENGSKLRKPNELPFDLCFGGRRQFCQSNYADLDSSREYEPLPTKGKFHALDFDTLLKQAQQSQKR